MPAYYSALREPELIVTAALLRTSQEVGKRKPHVFAFQPLELPGCEDLRPIQDVILPSHRTSLKAISRISHNSEFFQSIRHAFGECGPTGQETALQITARRVLQLLMSVQNRSGLGHKWETLTPTSTLNTFPSWCRQSSPCTSPGIVDLAVAIGNYRRVREAFGEPLSQKLLAFVQVGELERTVLNDTDSPCWESQRSAHWATCLYGPLDHDRQCHALSVYLDRTSGYFRHMTNRTGVGANNQPSQI
eukprot:SAG11_NODE_1102_length_5866_cov_2.173574_1_plen_247_part_00